MEPNTKIMVLIVGAGPAGLATSACLNRKSIPNIVLEREDCSASLWKRRSYDCLKLHLPKQLCQLPHMEFPPDAPTYVPKSGFINYLDEYVNRFCINPRYNRNVISSYYDGGWVVEAVNTVNGEREIYVADFLVVATGENSEGVIPEIRGMVDSFKGEYMHSSEYKNGDRFTGKDVLVIGSGNSGMEIAFDLSKSNANVSIVVRSPVHVLTREIVKMSMAMLRCKIFPIKFVDGLCLFLAKWRFGDTSRYGVKRPNVGPFLHKMQSGRSPTIDVGCIDEIKSGNVEVVPSVECIEGNKVVFEDGKSRYIDTIIFATGYKTNVTKWFQVNDGDLFNNVGMPKRKFPEHWKGENGLYCGGFARQGLAGISKDALSISQDIASSLGFYKE